MFFLVTHISWRSKKYDVVSRSSAEAKYCALAQTTAGVVWLRRLMVDMGVYITTPTSLNADNKSAIQIVRNHVFHKRTKHTEVDCHFVRHHFLDGTLALPYNPTKLQIADFFTKSHTIAHFRNLLSKLLLLVAPP